MQPAFEIDVDVALSLVRIRLTGLFDQASLKAFMAVRVLKLEQLRCGRNEQVTVIDVRHIAIQTQEVVSQWARILADPRFRSRRLAFVVACTLARAQLQRAIGTREARCFTDKDEAEAWLLTDSPSRQQAA